jgi:hypothetical protein
MKATDPEASRPEAIVAATLYLMTHYARTGCPRLALCISKHLQCLAAPIVVREICAGVRRLGGGGGEHVFSVSGASLH